MCKNFYSIELASSGPCYLINNSMVGMDVPLLHSPGKGPAAESCSLSAVPRALGSFLHLGLAFSCVCFSLFICLGVGVGFFGLNVIFLPCAVAENLKQQGMMDKEGNKNVLCFES